MKIQTFLEAVSDGVGGHLRTAALDLIEHMNAEDFEAFCAELSKYAAKEQYSSTWTRTEKIKYVLAYKSPCRPREVIAKLEKLDGGTEYPTRERQAIQATISGLHLQGKLSKTANINERPLYSLIDHKQKDQIL